MIIYVNGDSHTAAAEAVNQHAFAEDDSQFFYLGRAPHPANLAVSWGRVLADTVKATFKCDAESASSNARILRTSRAWAESHCDRSDMLMLVQWSTWEREEWIIDGRPYQVNASGQDHVPESHQERYREWISNLDWQKSQIYWHREIYCFHKELVSRNMRHVFFNGNNHFGNISESAHFDWGVNYISPYDANATYDQWLRRNGHDTVAPNSWHFGRSAHAAWSRFVLQYCINNRLVP
jgi:hypothetical protein